MTKRHIHALSSVRTTQAGFSLIELSIVLVIVGLITGGALTGYGYYAHGLKVKETEDRFDVVLDALSSYAQQYARLPCPATPASNGEEGDGGLCYTTASKDALYDAMDGTVPWRTLGIEEKYTRDGWGRAISYRPAPHLTVNNYSSVQQGKNGGSTDVHNACITTKWFTSQFDESTKQYRYPAHRDRARALFCCNVTPNTKYMDEVDGEGGTVGTSWRDHAVVATGNLTDTLDNSPAQTSYQWMDESSGATSGNFDDAKQSFDDILPQIRATGSAVTLISHGGDGLLSFTADGSRKGDGVLNIPAIERVTVTQKSDVSGMVFNPKISGAFMDLLGKKQDSSDDITVYQRSDQIFSRVGSASCVEPPPEFRICDAYDGYKNETFIIDSSMSMMEETQITAPRLNEDGSVMTEDDLIACQRQYDIVDGHGVDDPLNDGKEICGDSVETPVTRWQLAAKAAGLITRELGEAKIDLVSNEDMGDIGLNYFTGTGGDTGSQYTTGGEDDLYQNDAYKVATEDHPDLTGAYPSDYTFDPLTEEEKTEGAENPDDLENVNEIYYEERWKDVESELGVVQHYVYVDENHDGVADTDATGQKIVQLDDYGNPVTNSPAEIVVTDATPPNILTASASSNEGRGTPLVSNIIETAALMAEKTASAEREAILVISDGFDYTTPPPSGSDIAYACGGAGNNQFCEAAKDAQSECSADRESDSCVAALFEYAGHYLENEYPGRFALQVVDVAGENPDILAAFHDGTGVGGQVIDASTDSTGEGLTSAMHLALDMCTEEYKAPDDWQLYGDIYTVCDPWSELKWTCDLYERESVDGLSWNQQCNKCNEARASGDTAAQDKYCDIDQRKTYSGVTIFEEDGDARWRYCYKQQGPEDYTQKYNKYDYSSSDYTEEFKTLSAPATVKCWPWSCAVPSSGGSTTTSY